MQVGGVALKSVVVEVVRINILGWLARCVADIGIGEEIGMCRIGHEIEHGADAVPGVYVVVASNPNRRWSLYGEITRCHLVEIGVFDGRVKDPRKGGLPAAYPAGDVEKEKGIPGPRLHVQVDAARVAVLLPVVGIAGVYAAVGALDGVLFQHDVDDARRSLRIVTGRRVGDDLYAFDVLRRHGFQQIAKVSCGEVGQPVVDHHRDAVFSVELNAALGVNVYTGGFRQYAEGVVAGRHCRAFHRHHHAVGQLHDGRPEGSDGYVLQGLRFRLQRDGAEVFRAVAAGYRKAVRLPAGETNGGEPQDVRARLRGGQCKMPRGIGERARRWGGRTLRFQQGHVGKAER